MKYFLLLLPLTLASLIGFTGCESTSDDGGTGTMEVTMTDAPAHYDSVNVTINRVHVNIDENAEADTTEGNDEGWVTIMDETIQVDLLELTNGNTISLGSQELEAGRYSQIRFILGDNNTITVDGETYDLQTPSAQQSGLKLNIDADVEENMTYSLLVDFDAARSIVQQGNGGYLLKPVLRAVNLKETGSIIGTVQPSDFNTNVLAVANEDTVSTITAENGGFELIGLTSGSYDIIYDPSSDEYSDSTQTDVEVTVGEETDQGTIELEAQGEL